MSEKQKNKRKLTSEDDLFVDTDEEDISHKKPNLTRNESQHSISSSSEESEENEKKEDKKECPYGSKCYRKNPKHFQEFKHSKDSFANNMTEKWNKSSPFNYFLTKVKGINTEYNSNQAVHIKGKIMSINEINKEQIDQIVVFFQIYRYFIRIFWRTCSICTSKKKNNYFLILFIYYVFNELL